MNIRDTKNTALRAFELVTETVKKKKKKEDSFILMKTIGRKVVC